MQILNCLTQDRPQQSTTSEPQLQQPLENAPNPEKKELCENSEIVINPTDSNVSQPPNHDLRRYVYCQFRPTDLEEIANMNKDERQGVSKAVAEHLEKDKHLAELKRHLDNSMLTAKEKHLVLRLYYKYLDKYYLELEQPRKAFKQLGFLFALIVLDFTVFINYRPELMIEEKRSFLTSLQEKELYKLSRKLLKPIRSKLFPEETPLIFEKISENASLIEEINDLVLYLVSKDKEQDIVDNQKSKIEENQQRRKQIFYSQDLSKQQKRKQLWQIQLQERGAQSQLFIEAQFMKVWHGLINCQIPLAKSSDDQDDSHPEPERRDDLPRAEVSILQSTMDTSYVNPIIQPIQPIYVIQQESIEASEDLVPPELKNIQSGINQTEPEEHIEETQPYQKHQELTKFLTKEQFCQEKPEAHQEPSIQNSLTMMSHADAPETKEQQAKEELPIQASSGEEDK